MLATPSVADSLVGSLRLVGFWSGVTWDVLPMGLCVGNIPLLSGYWVRLYKVRQTN